MRLLLLALLSTACIHEKLYTVGDLRIEEERDSMVVWSMRSSALGTQVGPLFVAKPVSPAPNRYCFEGIFNPDRLPLDAVGAQKVIHEFRLCHDPDHEAPEAFRIDLKKGTQIVQVPFNVKVVPSGPGDIRTENGRVTLPEDPGPFKQHPELIGALIAVGALPAGSSVLER